MKPKNFPGRKLARVKGAAARLPATVTADERKTVEARADVSDSQARAVRTKKDRSHKAKIAR